VGETGQVMMGGDPEWLPSGCRVAAEWMPSGCRVDAEWMGGHDGGREAHFSFASAGRRPAPRRREGRPP
jgi:hypothetical protein